MRLKIHVLFPPGAATEVGLPEINKLKINSSHSVNYILLTMEVEVKDSKGIRFFDLNIFEFEKLIYLRTKELKAHIVSKWHCDEKRSSFDPTR